MGKRSFDPVYYADIILKNREPVATIDDTRELMRYADGVYYPAETEVENDALTVLDQWHEDELELDVKDKATGRISKNLEIVKFREGPSRYKINEILSYIKINSYTPRDWFDSDKNIINLQNGLFNIEKNKLKDHTPDYHSIIQLPIIYDSEADCPHIKKFLSEILDPGDIRIIQEFFGYCLYPRYHIQKAFMLLGGGQNGKSTLINLLKAFLRPENVSSVSLQMLNENRFASANLYGKLANLFADLPAKGIPDTGLFKMLTGGDQIYAEKKGKDSFNFVNIAKLLFSANLLPKVNDRTDSYFRRWVILNFPNQFLGKSDDKNLIAKLTSEDELSGLFNFAIQGLQRLLVNGDFSYSLTTDQVREDYQRKSDPVAAFSMDCLILNVENWIAKDEVYNAYRDYCLHFKLPTVSKISFNRDELPKIVSGLEDGGKVGPRGSQKPAWFGIDLERENIPTTGARIPTTGDFGSRDGSRDVAQSKIDTGSASVVGVVGVVVQTASLRKVESDEPEIKIDPQKESSKLRIGETPTTVDTQPGDLDFPT